MTKKKTDKAPSKTTATTEQPTTKKEVVTKTATVSANGMVEVVVKTMTFGTYKKGDTITMEQSTAKACVKNGVVTYK